MVGAKAGAGARQVRKDLLRSGKEMVIVGTGGGVMGMEERCKFRICFGEEVTALANRWHVVGGGKGEPHG